MFKSIIKNHFDSCIGLSMLVLVAAVIPPYAYIGLFFSSIYYIIKLLVRYIKKKPIKPTVINYSLWIIVCGSIITKSHLYNKAKKTHAAIALSAITEYVAEHNKYPEYLQETSYKLPERKYSIRYNKHENNVYLSYSPEEVPYYRLYFDFEDKEWTSRELYFKKIKARELNKTQ